VSDVQVVSIRLARVTFVTRRSGPQAAQCDRPPRAGRVTSACVGHKCDVVCDCVIRTQAALETIMDSQRAYVDRATLEGVTLGYDVTWG